MVYDHRFQFLSPEDYPEYYEVSEIASAPSDLIFELSPYGITSPEGPEGKSGPSWDEWSGGQPTSASIWVSRLWDGEPLDPYYPIDAKTIYYRNIQGHNEKDFGDGIMLILQEDLLSVPSDGALRPIPFTVDDYQLERAEKDGWQKWWTEKHPYTPEYEGWFFDPDLKSERATAYIHIYDDTRENAVDNFAHESWDVTGVWRDKMHGQSSYSPSLVTIFGDHDPQIDWGYLTTNLLYGDLFTILHMRWRLEEKLPWQAINYNHSFPI